MNKKLYQIDPNLKKLLSLFLIVLTIGVVIGLVYVRSTTLMKTGGIIERYNGSEVEDEFDIPENYPKSVKDLLLTTHNHVISFSLIFISISIVFYFNSLIGSRIKMLIIIEPFISIITTFGGIWGMRFIDQSFVYLVIISASLMYLCYFIMFFVNVFELNFKKS